ncbi:hypothetical protein [Nocardiopsis sp. ATB16-24]|uniref:hypothetical protein n=1 Tax=Nocardiopsis sp. ATB16-24 TaxID=3019555 RepID=UPI0025554559|nr:hypothetical protein [Nocardiopsis sp. ATB16-24]
MVGIARRSRRSAVCGWMAAVGVMVGTAAIPAYADDGGGVPQVPPGGGAGPATRIALVLEAGAEPSRPGHELTLRTTVTNDDGEDVEEALLAQHVPEALEILEVGEEGVVNEGIVNWRVRVPAGEESEYTVRVRAPEETQGRERLMSTACLLLDRTAEPVACASGTVVVTEATVGWRMSEYANAGGPLRVAGVVVVAVAAGLVWVLWRRGSVPGRR